MAIVDTKEPLELDLRTVKPFEAVRYLFNDLYRGLDFLNDRVASFERKNFDDTLIGDFSNLSLSHHQAEECINDVISPCFQWYAVTAYSFVQLVGHVYGKSKPENTEYIKRVMGVVLMYRNKVGAHTALAAPYETDNLSDKGKSVFPHPCFAQRGRLKVCDYQLGNPIDGTDEFQYENHDFAWSLTEFHEKFVARYPREPFLDVLGS